MREKNEREIISKRGSKQGKKERDKKPKNSRESKEDKQWES